MHSAINYLSCYITTYLQNVRQESERPCCKRAWQLPSWLICSFPTFHLFRISCLTIYVQSTSCDMSFVDNTDPQTHILQQQWTLQQQMGASLAHRKTQCQASLGIHVAVLVFKELKELPTTCGMPLSSMPKSSPPYVFSVRNHKTPHRRWTHSFKEGIFVAFTACMIPNVFTVF